MAKKAKSSERQRPPGVTRAQWAAMKQEERRRALAEDREGRQRRDSGMPDFDEFPEEQDEDYAEHLAEELVERVAAGSTIRMALKQMGIKWRCYRQWLREHDDFRSLLEEAEREQLRAWEELMVDIADRASDAALAALQIKTRQWLMSKRNHRRYGDSSSIRMGGDPDAPPVQTTSITASVSPEEAAAAYQQMLRWEMG